MSMRKYEELLKRNLEDELWGLVLKKGEKSRLYEICLKYNIPITYPSLFTNDKHYSLWGISKTGIGLVSTIIMNYLSESSGIIFNSLDELEKYLEKQNTCN